MFQRHQVSELSRFVYEALDLEARIEDTTDTINAG